MQLIAFDVHKKYTWATVERPGGGLIREARIPHERGMFMEFLKRCEPGSPVAVETTGNWYWVIDEIEQAGFIPRLVNARKAKLMMGAINKTDKLDNRGINLLQRNGTLPTVWIPPAPVRDQRELPRTRMALVRQRTQLKNRIHATLSKHGLRVEGVSDMFGVKGRKELQKLVPLLPPHTQEILRILLCELDHLFRQTESLEERIERVFEETADIRRIRTLPGVGLILSMVIHSEIGSIDRFPSAEKLASYSGCTPRVHSSGDKTRYGKLRKDVNQYLKWAFVEAANHVSRRQAPMQHLTRLYQRIRQKKGHGKAIGAAARHLAEATYWILTKGENYREPELKTALSTGG